MTPRELRADIPALQDGTYLNYGAHGPSPRSVVDAATGFLESHEYGSVEYDPYTVAVETYEDVREQIAAFVAASSSEIALTESTTDGINRIATAIEWEAGDVVVRTDVEHPAGVLPWQRLERAGVDVRVVETTDGRVDTDDFAEAVMGARLVFFSALTWTHGTRLPVRAFVEIAEDVGAFTLVDAVQVPGQSPVDMTEWGADAVAAAGHKWLLGPWGSGFLFVDNGVGDELTPGAIGYRSVADPAAPSIEYKEGAARFEVGSTSPAAHVGLTEAIDVIEAVGMSRIESRITSLTERLKAGLDDDVLLSPQSHESGLVSVAADDPDATVAELAERGIVVRSIPAIDAVRISVHAVSTEAEIDATLEALEDAL